MLAGGNLVGSAEIKFRTVGIQTDYPFDETALKKSNRPAIERCNLTAFDNES